MRSATRSTIVCDVQVRVHLGELAKDAREHDAAGPGRGSDLEGALELARRLLGELGEQVLLELQQPLRAAVEAQPCLGGLDAPP